jgi:hypothetical protein
MLYLSSYSRGADWLQPLDGVGEWLAGAFGGQGRSARHVRVSARSGRAAAGAQARSTSTSASASTPGRPSQAEVDRILDKIKAVGYDRLTVEEKQTLLNASKS